MTVLEGQIRESDEELARISTEEERVLARVQKHLAARRHDVHDQVAASDQQQTDLQVTRGDECSVDDARGSLIAAHRIDGDAQLYASFTSLTGRPL